MNFEPAATLSADNMRMGYGKTYKGATSIEKMYNSDEEHKVLDNLPPLHIDFAACDSLELIQATNPEVALIKRNLNPKQYLEASKQEIIKALEEGRYQKNSIELLYLLNRINKTDIDNYLGNEINQIPEKYREIFMSAALYYKQEGRQERTFSIAKNMLAENFDMNVITQLALS